jgi:Ni,Fe-hydrogenase III small subunit
MDGQLIQWAIMAMIAIGEALDKLGCPVLAIGPRNAGPGYRYVATDIEREEMYSYDPETRRHIYHYSRTDSVVIDVFKDWNERMAQALPRFAAVKACGSTPLSDGIQFALQELQARSERHRVVFVITDGCPDNSDCVRWQIRTAAEAGVTVVGVGIGWGASYVESLFPVHVCVPNVDALPQELLRVLSDIMFPQRARKMDLGSKKMKSK